MARGGGTEGRRALQIGVLDRRDGDVIRSPPTPELDEPKLEQDGKQPTGGRRRKLSERAVQPGAAAQGAVGADEAGAQREVSIQDIPAIA